MSGGLECEHDAHFLFRRGPGEHTDAVDGGGQLLIVQGVKLDAGYNSALNAQFAGDGGGRNLLVPGDHFDRDPRLAAQGDGIASFGSGRIHQAHQSGEYEVFHIDKQVTVWLKIPNRKFRPGGSQHPQACGRHVLVSPFDKVSLLRIQRLITVLVKHHRAVVQQYVRGALDHDPHPLAIEVKSHLVLVFSLKRNLGNSPVVLLQFYRIKPTLRRDRQQSTFHRVAGDLAGAQLGFVAQRDWHQQGLQIRHTGVAATDLAGGLVALAADLKMPATGIKPADGHLVDGQRTGLVGANNRCTTQGFHRRQAFDDGLVACHALQADCQRHRHHCGQTFGDGGHGEGDGRHDHHHPGLTTQQAGDQHESDHDAGDQRKSPAQRIQLDLQRRGRIFGLPQHVRQQAQFCIHPGGGHHHFCPAAGYDRVHEKQIGALRQRNILACQRINLLAHGARFSGQRGFVNFKIMRGNHATIGRHAVAGAKQNDVPRHQFISGQYHGLTVAAHFCCRSEHFFQCSERLFGAVFLGEAQHCVNHHHNQNHHRIGKVPDCSSEHGRSDQHQD